MPIMILSRSLEFNSQTVSFNTSMKCLEGNITSQILLKLCHFVALLPVLQHSVPLMADVSMFFFIRDYPNQISQYYHGEILTITTFKIPMPCSQGREKKVRISTSADPFPIEQP